MTVGDALAAAGALGVARLDGQLLALHALGRRQSDRAWVLAHDDVALDAAQQARFMGECMRRASGEPLAYIVGHKEFFGLDLHVDERVLVPRPDTETLVEWALELLPKHTNRRVVDLGTGSGAIALAIRKHRPEIEIEAVDRSADALEVAQGNARTLGLEVLFRQGAWLEGATGPYDLIVSNPPYVADADPRLADLTHEPRTALAAGPDGLSDLRLIVGQAGRHLQPGGWLLLEHGHDQAAAVREMLAGAGFGWIGSRRDLAGIERCSGGQWLELG